MPDEKLEKMWKNCKLNGIVLLVIYIAIFMLTGGIAIILGIISGSASVGALLGLAFILSMVEVIIAAVCCVLMIIGSSKRTKMGPVAEMCWGGFFIVLNIVSFITEGKFGILNLLIAVLLLIDGIKLYKTAFGKSN